MVWSYATQKSATHPEPSRRAPPGLPAVLRQGGAHKFAPFFNPRGGFYSPPGEELGFLSTLISATDLP